MDHAATHWAVRLPAGHAGSERRETLRLCAAVLTAALLVHLSMLLQPPHQTAAVSSPVAAADADAHGGASQPAHAMVATCVAVLSLLAAARATTHSRHWGFVGRGRGARVPLAYVSAPPSKPARCARGPTRIDAGVVLRV